ncbi:hypothetical protein NDN08_002004 [Rhodosorus marinus]|uniref:Dolichyl-phosphate-mannose--protein mannosyltransferase n=1 Tax=Rhodosorus marinus TaxID=101924 RepID=A0AAV8UWS1_9RHOD|nr:hypothetical protein NDN08_002004 [Rhodosorus marinus]
MGRSGSKKTGQKKSSTARKDEVGGKELSSSVPGKRPADGKKANGGTRRSDRDRMSSLKLLVDKPWTRTLLVSALLLVASIIVRLYRLEHPRSVVFDETHFGKFTDWYLKGEFFFDIHPPLAKMVFAYLGSALGYELSEVDPYRHIGLRFKPGDKFLILRGISAFFGAFVPVFMFLTCEELDLPLESSLLATSAVLFEHMLVVESRLILINSQLMFYLSLSLYFAVRLWKSSQGTPQRWIFLVLTALAATGAISVKWTAGVTPFVIALVSFFGLLFPHARLTLSECGIAATIAFSAYTLLHYLHFKALPNTGQGTPFVSQGFRATLQGSEYYGKVPEASFWSRYYELSQAMFWLNKGTTKAHPFMSPWYTWPLSTKHMIYAGGIGLPGSGPVKLIVNPGVALLTVSAVGITILATLLSIRYRDSRLVTNSAKTLHMSAALVAAWILNLLPYMAVERSAFLYHYLPGLYYAQILLGVVVAGLPKVPRRIAASLMIATIVAAFINWSPWIYGLAVPRASKWRLNLFDSWY